MSLLRRRGRGAGSTENPLGWVDEDAQAEETDVHDPGSGHPGDSEGDEAPRTEDSAPEPSDRSNGPWDASEVSDREGYLDLGGIMLPARDGMEVRLDVDEQTGMVTAATVVLGGSVVQLQAFAAPRSEGIWAEIRAEIAVGITRQGGTADEVPGSFGQELLARIPVRTPDGRTSHQPARFTGIDGPRWFLRAVFHGPAAYEHEAAGPLEALVREVIVVRGKEAMAPRELLVLKLPQGAAEQQPESEPDREPLNPFERGPEITEVR